MTTLGTPVSADDNFMTMFGTPFLVDDNFMMMFGAPFSADDNFMMISWKQKLGKGEAWSLCESILGLCSMCRAPPSYFARACVWLDVAFDNATHVLC